MVRFFLEVFSRRPSRLVLRARYGDEVSILLTVESGRRSAEAVAHDGSFNVPTGGVFFDNKFYAFFSTDIVSRRAH